MLCGSACAGTTNILFFGNSHTICYPAYGNTPTGLAMIVRKIAIAAGQPAPDVFAQASTGKDLAWHITTCTNAGTNSIIYSTLLTGQVWHFVVLQENTTKMKTAPATSRADALTLANLVRAHSTNVQVVHRQNLAFHTNCSYYTAAPNWYPEKFADPAGMHEYYRTNVANTVAYLNSVLGANRARLAPDGDGFKNALWPEDLYRPNDFAHGNNRGWLICGMTVYKTIYGGTITNIPVANVGGLMSDLGLTSADWQELALYVEPIPEPALCVAWLATLTGVTRRLRGKYTKLERN